MSSLGITQHFFEGHNVRTVTVGGEPWFVGTDVAEALGYIRSRDAIATHCKGAVKHGILTAGGIQSMNIIPEYDIYRLIMRSSLPSAEKFADGTVANSRW